VAASLGGDLGTGPNQPVRPGGGSGTGEGGAALGFLLMVSLAVSAALTAFAERINVALPFGGIILSALNILVSLALISFLFAAVFKVLPDSDLQWRDVAVGAVITAILFVAGKSLIGWYVGSSAVASTYGAAAGLIVLLLWVYYTSQIFLFGAELARAYASLHGSQRPCPKQEKQLRPAAA
jgi:membrane protein